MDFRLYARVLWRFRVIVAGGLVLAVLLAALSIVRVSSHGISYRRSERHRRRVEFTDAPGVEVVLGLAP